MIGIVDPAAHKHTGHCAPLRISGLFSKAGSSESNLPIIGISVNGNVGANGSSSKRKGQYTMIGERTAVPIYDARQRTCQMIHLWIDCMPILPSRTSLNAKDTAEGRAALENVVAIARSLRADYGALTEPESAPELRRGEVVTVAHKAVRDLLLVWGLDSERAGTAEWNPLGVFIAPGDRVLLKPNLVRHWNQSGAGLNCLLTHTSVIEAVLEFVMLARPRSVVVGDAPLQSCDFNTLRAECRLDEAIRRFDGEGIPVRLTDFRRTVMHGDKLGAGRSEDLRAIEEYVLFDLGPESLLEPVTTTHSEFRVTVYNPDFLERTHHRGTHEYLVARDCIEAEVVINLPKLKCHKKAGITGALKNLVGINGNKEYLPHHRKGGSLRGGDCYVGSSWLKGCAEDLLDAANRSRVAAWRCILAGTADRTLRLAAATGSDTNLEGSWHGNDTVWRTCLDLQRILRYGRLDGSMAATPQRRVVSITDAIVGGEGEGPLAPTPVPSGFLTGAANPAAAEWTHARLMGFDPARIPLVRRRSGSSRTRWPHFLRTISVFCWRPESAP